MTNHELQGVTSDFTPTPEDQQIVTDLQSYLMAEAGPNASAGAYDAKLEERLDYLRTQDQSAVSTQVGKAMLAGAFRGRGAAAEILRELEGQGVDAELIEGLIESAESQQRIRQYPDLLRSEAAESNVAAAWQVAHIAASAYPAGSQQRLLGVGFAIGSMAPHVGNLSPDKLHTVREVSNELTRQMYG